MTQSLTSASATETATSADVPVYPMPRATGSPFDPPPALRAMQATAPLGRVRLWDGSTPWVITRYEDQRSLLADPRLSSDLRRDGFPHISESSKQRRSNAISFITKDDPDHARERRMVTAPFAIKRIEALRPAIQRIVDDLIDKLLAGPKPADLVTEFALPVPSLVICELLGVPYADHDFFQANSQVMIKRNTPVGQAVAAQEALVDYLDDLIGHKTDHADDGLLSKLVEEQVKTGGLTRRELAQMGMLLLVAGHETTANMIALGTLALLEHPDQLAILRDTEDPKVIAGAVEELLRYLTIVHSGRRRVAVEDIELDGQVIKAGDGVIVTTDVGNRSAEMFPEPDRLDVTRDARRHVAFGFGVHQCLGQPLARVELQVVYGTLYKRMPALAAAKPLDEIPFKHDGLVYGVYELPVTW